MDDGIRTDLDVTVDVSGSGIRDGDAGRHQLFVLALSHQTAHFRQLGLAVDTVDLVGVRRGDRFDGQLPSAIHLQDGRQITFALGTGLRHIAQGREEGRQVEGVDATVDFPDRTLPG